MRFTLISIATAIIMTLAGASAFSSLHSSQSELPSTATTGKTVQPKIIDAGSDKELCTGQDIGCTRLWLADEVCEWHANRLGSPSQFKR